ncbi:peptidoglycan DD-metalloendopeptidase family protein [Streptomyces griseorubiginosus]|uniref:M23 family metallopeptidase n=1 Tax=Streptomyces griseorubiginosus TaxID=67304 RepID=UPI003655EE99
MRSPRLCALLVPVLLCALVAVPTIRPTHTTDDGVGRREDGDSELSAQVARLYEDAALATQRYEAGRQKAEMQRARARRFEDLLARERREIAVLHEDLGRIARSQYRDGGGLPLTAQIILADDLNDLMRGQHVFSRTTVAVNNAVDKSRRAEARLAADEAKAMADRRKLERRSAELAALKHDIERTLDEARWQLQGRADASVAAGACRGAVRLDQPPQSPAAAWVTPVAVYELSAGFGSGGSRWANGHTGQDFAVPIGTPVRAVGAGRVVKVSCGGPFGIEIVIEHPGGYYTQYAHLAAVTVDQGEAVAPGQWIGQSGTSGNSTGPHLHFEVRVTPETGSAVDPVPWLAARGVPLG